jgi:tRNA threonylcarbamoyladenosine biosynthesis protein TsaE
VIVVETVGPEAAEVVHRLTQAAFAGYDVLTPPSGALAETVEVVAAHLASEPGVVAYLDGVPAGAARLVEQEGELHVRRVAVDPAYQGRGVCSALIRHVEDAARAAGRTELHCGVRRQLPANRALFEHLGYVAVAEHDVWTELAKRL